MSAANRNLSMSSKTLSPQKIAELEESLQNNPYFIKFKDRIVKLKLENPETYLARLELMHQQHEAQKKKEAGNPKNLDEISAEQAEAAAAQPSYVAPKTLDTVMDLQRLKNKDGKEISDIWRKFHSHRSAVFASISKKYWDYFAAIKTHFPSFIYPLPRDDNKWLFYIGFWGGNELNFTTLEHYKLKGADAPVLLSMCHYPDLVETKGICLMVADVDESLIEKHDAQLLAYYAQYFHTEPKGMTLVQTFNTRPQDFKYNDVIKAVETIGQE